MALRDDVKDRVQQATDLVRLIGEQIALKPKGREFVGLCPFHTDKNPSFFVSPAKQIYKCFACNAGGDAFAFVMNFHKMTFPEALRHLAERAGIEIEERGGRGEGRGGRSEREVVSEANERATGFFRAMLKDPERGKAARDYIEKRGISPEMVGAFQLGYAPDDWEGLIHAARRKGWDFDALVKAELVLPRKSGSGHFDFFRHRLVFPILDGLGRPVAFGGRKLREEDEPKYLNSRETVVFHKSRTFYGLHLAKQPIIAARTAVIVEGYTDVIACHQAGFQNVVATLGTALTGEHVAELRKYADKVVCFFDADQAGDRAAERAVGLFLTADVDVAVAELPTGPGGSKMDPADLFALEEGPEVWRRCLESAKDALEYQFSRVRDRLEGADSVTARQRVVEAYLTQVAQLGLAQAGAIRRTLVIQRLAAMLRMPEGQVEELVRQAAARAMPRSGGPGPGPGLGPTPGQGAAPPPADQGSNQVPNRARNRAPNRASTAAPADGGDDPFAPANPGRAGGVESGSAYGVNNEGLDVAPSLTGSRLRAIEQAERQIIGCLLRDNGLFTQPLPGGLALDEAIAPTDMHGQATGRLYARVYEALAEGLRVDLRGLLSELAASGEPGLSAEATEADTEVDRALGGREEQDLEGVFGTATERWLAVRKEHEFEAEKAAMLHRVRQGSDTALQARLLERTREHVNGRASPVRILRPRR